MRGAPNTKKASDVVAHTANTSDDTSPILTVRLLDFDAPVQRFHLASGASKAEIIRRALRVMLPKWESGEVPFIENPFPASTPPAP